MNLLTGCLGVAIGIVKYLLCFLNFLVILPGIALIVCGVLLQSVFVDYYGSVFQDVVNDAAVAVIVVGSIILVVGVCGCLGSMLSCRSLLLAYGVLMIGVIAAQMAYGIVLLTKVNAAKQYVQNELKTTFYDDFADDQTSEFFDVIQDELNCCGVDSPKDYLLIFPNGSVPATCCRRGYYNPPDDCNQVTAYSTGCLNPFSAFMSSVVAAVGGLMMAMAVIQLLPTAVGFSLAHRYRTPRQSEQPFEIRSDVVVNVVHDVQVDERRLGAPFEADEKDWDHLN